MEEPFLIDAIIIVIFIVVGGGGGACVVLEFFSKFSLTCFFLIFAKNLHVSHVRRKPHAAEGLQVQS